LLRLASVISPTSVDTPVVFQDAIEKADLLMKRWLDSQFRESTVISSAQRDGGRPTRCAAFAVYIPCSWKRSQCGRIVVLAAGRALAVYGGGQKSRRLHYGVGTRMIRH